MAEEKFSKDVDLKEGALTAMGWPDAGKVVANVKAGKTPYKTAIQRLQYLVNINSPAKTKAQALIVRLQKEVGSKDEGKKTGPPSSGPPPKKPTFPPSKKY